MRGEKRKTTAETVRRRVIIKTPLKASLWRAFFSTPSHCTAMKALLFKAVTLMVISDPCGWRRKSTLCQFVCERKWALLLPRRTATDLSYCRLWSHGARRLFVFRVGEASQALSVFREMKGGVLFGFCLGTWIDVLISRNCNINMELMGSWWVVMAVFFRILRDRMRGWGEQLRDGVNMEENGRVSELERRKEWQLLCITCCCPTSTLHRKWTGDVKSQQF